MTFHSCAHIKTHINKWEHKWLTEDGIALNGEIDTEEQRLNPNTLRHTMATVVPTYN